MYSRRYAAALSAALAVVIGSGGMAAADPPDPGTTPSQSQVDAVRADVAKAARQQRDAESKLDAAQAKLDAVNAAAEMASEKYNQSRAILAQRVAATKTAQAKAAKAQQVATAAQTDLDHLAASVYMQGGSLDGLEAILSTAGFGDMARHAADVESVGSFRQRTLSDARSSAAQAESTRRAAAQAQVQQAAAAASAQADFTAAKTAAATAASQATALKAERDAVVAQLAALRRTSVAVEEARVAGLARAGADRAAMARLAASTAPTGPLPAPNTAAAAGAIAYAKAQIGKPYIWAAEGPDAFDCSGLTMQAWRAVGVGLTHYTGWQWDQTSRVPLDKLQPGDLVFYGKDVPSIHHVGLYVGNGTMIEAPHTGAFVRYSTIYRSDLMPYGGRPSR